jgi:DamX protein
MSSLAQALENPTQQESVTTISAIARVDYILRFSKQAVMVVDEQIALCSSVGSQFLSNLSSDHNAAYITMSAKLNDLQVRCRIIEQLFGNTLFDPEQSVAVSLINLVKQHKQPVSIVIDNAHLLSLQLTHELCQLAEIAKRSDHQISILMLSTPQGGLKVCQNQSLFHKKLTIISAQSGQLISHNSKTFKPKKNYLAITPIKKWIVFFLVLALVAAGSVYLLFKRDVFGFSVAINQLTASKHMANNSEPVSEAFVIIPDDANEIITGQQLASINDILTSIIEGPVEKIVTVEKLPEKAKPVDIINAIEAFTLSNDAVIIQSDIVNNLDNNEIKSDGVESTLQNLKALISPMTKKVDSIEVVSEGNVESISDKIDSTISASVTTELFNNVEEESVKLEAQLSSFESNIYQGQKQGFVIQIGGFTQQNVLNEFLADFQELSFFQYRRLVNNEVMTILTSEYFLNREQAEQAFTQLPQAIKDRSPWIKSISVINDEINHFQRSQSGENKVTIPAS